MTVARHDPLVLRFKPDQELVARAHNAMLADEDELDRYVRQRYEDAFGAVRVAMDLLREIYPRERDAMTEWTRTQIATALTCMQGAYERLDDCSEDLLGAVMLGVLRGAYTTHEQLDELGIPR